MKVKKCMELFRTKRTDPFVLSCMNKHYSQPKGFVGRNIVYLVCDAGALFGVIVAGSATRHLPGRADFINRYSVQGDLNNFVNNIFFHVNGPYPSRNFVQKTLALFRETVRKDWFDNYRDKVQLFETLVELPRLGDCYIRDRWTEVGITKGFTCKRIGGLGTDSWTGKRVWNTTDLRPKRVFMRLP